MAIAMPDSEFAIETRNLTKVYPGGVKALDDVTIQIRKGDIVGYLGPNGAGKTTTIKILTNLLKPTSGQAFVNGIDVNRRPKDALKSVGALIEVPGVYDYLTPNQMLTYFGKVQRMPESEIQPRIEEVLKDVKLSDWEHKKLSSFSTGMQRRFAIAKAILHKPAILILDEPVLGLDPKGMKDVRDLIKDFKDHGMTIFLSSHLLAEVSETCDTVMFIDHGKIKTVNTVRNILHGTEQTTIEVEFLNPLTSEQLKGLGAVEGVTSVESVEGRHRLKYDGKPQTSRLILQRMVREGFEVFSFSPHSMDLEDYYLSIMDDEPGVN